MMKQIDGQMDLFDYLTSLAKEKKDNVLMAGQKIYKVFLCNIKEYIIKSIYSMENRPDEYGMTLESEDGSKSTGYSWQVDRNIFLTLDKAEKKVKKEKGKYNVIYACDMHPVSWKVYYYIRKCDGRKMYMFYALLDNGYVYAKDHYTYDYLKKCSEKEALKHLMDQVQSINEKWIEEPTLPHDFKNMYLCNHGDWLYTEAECSYVEGRTPLYERDE